MKYDFTSIIDRQGQDAMAVDGLGMYPGMSPSKPKGGFVYPDVGGGYELSDSADDSGGHY